VDCAILEDATKCSVIGNCDHKTIMLFCNGARTVNPLLRHLFAESLFCPWSAHDRHLMGLDEEEADQSDCA
jgi:hypothetical protein